MENTEGRWPAARSESLLCRELPGGELILYDTDRHQAHSLNRTSAFIWQQCDGQTNIAALAARLQGLDVPTDEGLVWLALEQLAKAHLLREPLIRPPDQNQCSRRGLIRKLGLAGGLAALLPLVDSMTAPASAAAVSQVACLPKLSACSPGGTPCCFGICASLRYGYICC
jgi:coenzyme PQQ synthesis protein D (PqqD)